MSDRPKIAFSELTERVYILPKKWDKIDITENFKDILVHYLRNFEDVWIKHKSYDISVKFNWEIDNKWRMKWDPWYKPN